MLWRSDFMLLIKLSTILESSLSRCSSTAWNHFSMLWRSDFMLLIKLSTILESSLSRCSSTAWNHFSMQLFKAWNHFGVGVKTWFGVRTIFGARTQLHGEVRTPPIGQHQSLLEYFVMLLITVQCMNSLLHVVEKWFHAVDKCSMHELTSPCCAEVISCCW